jgi:hypothetical protein
MTDKLIDALPTKADHELRVLRQNAQNILDNKRDATKYTRAEALLDAIDKELECRHLPGMIATFKEAYPDGFYGQTFLEIERDYKVEASELCHVLLEQSVFAELIQAGSWDELFERVKKLANKTNLIQASFERPKLFDKIRELGVPAVFYPALYDCLYGSGGPAARLGRFADTLTGLELNKWTYASYFIFLHDPQNCIFVKPDGFRKSIAITQYPLEYESSPSAELYEEVLAFSRWLANKLVELKPRDMIDIQSFMWHMAPTGIHAKDD